MELKWIVAMSENWVIWKNGKLPRKNQEEDIARLREKTNGQICLMGRKTYEWLKQYRPNSEWYPHAKKNLIFSQTMDDKPWIEIIHNYDELQTKYGNEIIWVLWWAKTFESLLPYIDEIYITLIPWNYEWDTLMPKLPPGYISTLKTKGWLMFKKYKKITDPEAINAMRIWEKNNL